MVSSLNNQPWLAFVEKLLGDSVSGQGEAELPQLFRCQLDEQPDHLVAERYLNFNFKPDVQLFVNPQCVFTQDGELPDQFSGPSWLFSNFDLHGTVVWVRDPGTGTITPFW
jgi:hypothetical protein